jgi:adhesin transport system membrane fusion protein
LASIVIDKSANDWRQRIRIIEQPLADENTSPVILDNARASYHERIEQLHAQLEQSRQNIEQQVQAFDEVRRGTQTLARNLELVSEEVSLTKDVVASGAVAKVELLKLQREQSSLKGELAASGISEQRLMAARDQAVAEYRNTARDFRSKAQVELVETENQLAQLFQRSAQLEDQLSRTQLISPVRGNVKNIVTRSVGGVIKPGEAMMEVVPLDDQLLVETRIAPKDIAFVHEGLPATVKLTAYDFVIYGGVKGEVVYVSADAQQDQEGIIYYEAHIKTQQPVLQSMPMIPGMQASVDVLTGKKTVLNYWLKPLLRARANAMREP